MTDAEWEAHIKSCHLLIKQSVEQYLLVQHLSYLWEATEWLRLMEEAIEGLSAEQDSEVRCG